MQQFHVSLCIVTATKSFNDNGTAVWQEPNNTPGMKVITVRHWIKKHRKLERLPLVRRMNDFSADFLAAKTTTHF